MLKRIDEGKEGVSPGDRGYLVEIIVLQVASRVHLSGSASSSLRSLSKSGRRKFQTDL